MRIEEIMKSVDVSVVGRIKEADNNDENIVRRIIERAEETDFYFHDKSNTLVESLEGYIILKNGFVCPVYEDDYFCLRPFQLREDGNLQISRWTVGGNVDTRGQSLYDAIQEYNERLEKFMKLANRPNEKLPQYIVHFSLKGGVMAK